MNSLLLRMEYACMKGITFLCLMLLMQTSFAQQKEVQVNWIEEEISLDGALDEAAWQSADVATDFWQYFPTDTLLSTSQTEVRMLFDKKYLYVGIKVYSIGDDYVVPSLKRDFSARANDNISMMFDTYRDGNNAFMFGTNPEGVQREALIAGGGSRTARPAPARVRRVSGVIEQYTRKGDRCQERCRAHAVHTVVSRTGSC